MIAIFTMVFVHFAENLSGVGLPIAGFGAPLFAFLSGVSYLLWVNGQMARGRSDAEISKVSIRRGLFVFGVGFAFNVLVWLPEDIFNWDVLTFIGAALLVLNIARRLPLSVSAMTAAVILMISPLLRAQVEYEAYWANGYFELDPTLSDVLIGFFVTGYFPLFPWLVFSLAGFTTASLLFGEATESGAAPEDAEPAMLSPRWLIAIGAVSLGIAIAIRLLHSHLPEVLAKTVLGGWTMFPPTTTYVFGTLGWAFLLFGAAHLLIDRNPRMLRRKGLLDIAKTFSRYSFTIYVLHHIVHLWPLWIYGVVTGNEPTHFWQNSMPIYISLPLALVFMITCFVLLRWIGPERRFGIEAWMRWLCD